MFPIYIRIFTDTNKRKGSNEKLYVFVDQEQSKSYATSLFALALV